MNEDRMSTSTHDLKRRKKKNPLRKKALLLPEDKVKAEDSGVSTATKPLHPTVQRAAIPEAAFSLD